MFEKTKNILNKALNYAEQLVNSITYNPKSIEENIIPKKIGVYLWRSKKNNEIVYVGRAFGKEGLYKRILKQHLSNSYTKSVFKQQIAKENNLNIKEETVVFIKENFNFSFVPFEKEDKNVASLVEIILIKEYSPKYNRAEKF